MEIFRLALTCIALSVTACGSPPTLQSQMTELSAAGAAIKILTTAGNAKAASDNPECEKQACIFYGRGVYIGDGLVLTAAHVVSKVALGEWVKLEMQNYDGGGQLVWAGLGWSRGHNDLAIIRVSRALLNMLAIDRALKPIPLCPELPTRDHDVIIVGQHLLFPTRMVVWKDRSGEHYFVSAELELGVSGSAVVDARNICVEGVVSAQNGSSNWYDKLDDYAASKGDQESYVTPIDAEIVQAVLRTIR